METTTRFQAFLGASCGICRSIIPGSHEHPTLFSLTRAEPGNGLLLFFRVDDVDDALSRAKALVGEFEEEPEVNPATGTREFALRDPGGYYVMVSALA